MDGPYKGPHLKTLWVCSTNNLGAPVHTSLLQQHKTNYPNLLAKIRFDPADNMPTATKKGSASGHTRESIIPASGHTRETVKAYGGTIIQVPLRIVERGLPLEWRYAGWGTVHLVQGKTVGSPGRIYIVDHSLSSWVSNAIYTVILCVWLVEQVVRVLPPGDAPGPVVPMALQATSNRTLIEAWLKCYMVGDRRKGRPKYTEAYHKLTVEM